MEAARLLRAARARARLTQRELAERARVPQPSIADIERGKQDPRFRTLERLLRACEHEVDLMPIAGLGVDRTQFRVTLRLSPAGRLRRMAQSARAARELSAVRRIR